jgi:hypothetical protein
MMAMPDYPESSAEFDNNEDDTISAPSTPTPTFRVINTQDHTTATTPTRNITINYRHCYSIERNNGDEVDLPSLLQSLAQHAIIKTPSSQLKTSHSTAADNESPAKLKEKTLCLGNSSKPLVYTALDIDDPPHLKYSNDMDGLIRDWEDSNHFRIRNVAIPLKYWSQVFRWAKPETWDVLKDMWSNWRVCSCIEISELFKLTSISLC